ncbi:M56 family metallopeptidase [Ferruginibacter sp.]
MMLYIVKTVLCAALLFLFYTLFLEREKMHRFKRAYLLVAVVLSFTIPLITIPTPAVINVAPLQQSILLPVEQPVVAGSSQPLMNTQTDYIALFILFLYAAIALFRLAVFTRNMVTIYSRIRNNAQVHQGNATFILLEKNVTPHSFLHFIFLDKTTYENGAIEKEVISHELTHVRQKHSLDIIFIELLLVFFWFNPFLYLYRRAIQLNHEFLADDAVVETFHNATAYQYLLLEKAAQPGSSPLTSQFNYLITKKRLLMMTRTTSKSIAIVKQWAVLPVIAAAIFVFSTNTMAQDIPKVIQKAVPETPSTVEGVSQQLLDEYADIINKNKTTDGKYGPAFYVNVSPEEKQRLETIYLQMSKEQQAKQKVIFMPPAPPLPKVVPTKEQFEALKNAAVYGVWLNGKKINNSVLDKYSNTDFEQIFISKLYGPAKKNRSYTHQVNLMTTAYYREYYSSASNNKGYLMAIRIDKKVQEK